LPCAAPAHGVETSQITTRIRWTLSQRMTTVHLNDPYCGIDAGFWKLAVSGSKSSSAHIMLDLISFLLDTCSSKVGDTLSKVLAWTRSAQSACALTLEPRLHSQRLLL
jgi:hypothetical protein